MSKFKDNLICSLIRFSAIFSLAGLHKFARFLANIMLLIPNKTTFVTQRNIDVCFPQMSPDEKEQLVENSLFHTACIAVEMGPMWLWPSQRVNSLVKSVHNEHLIEQALEQGKGIIILAPHIGNWELLNIYLSQKLSLTVMYKPHELEKLDEMIRLARERSGSETAPANHRGVAKVRKVLKQGGATGILPDQVPATEGAVLVPFFGVPAQTMTLLPALAGKTGAVVIPAMAKRLEHSEGFEIHFLDVDSDIYSEDVEIAATAMNKAVEACVHIAPEQYQWEYRRFRRGGFEGQPVYA